MPVEINELHITTVIRDGGEQTTPGAGLSDQDKEKIINECVEKVMEIIKEKNER